MPFTSAPNYDEMVSMSDFIGDTVILHPVSKQLQKQTKFGPVDAWTVIVFKLAHDKSTGVDFLESTPGVTVFSKKLVAQLDLARMNNEPVAGTVHRNGNGIRLEQPDELTIQTLEFLWNKTDHS